MNKEQFKKSISNLINYYTNSAINHSVNMLDAQNSQNEEVCGMIQGQMQMLTQSFEYSLDELLDKAFPDEEEDSVVGE